MDNVAIVLSQYRLGKTLGIGAFGKVKLAHHIVTGVKVAIKILNKGKISSTEETAEKVRREINILQMTTHPHIIRLYEVIDTPSDIFVVMEFVPGGELFDYILPRGRLSPDEARHYFQQNLLLDGNNNIKIADFGLSNISHDGEFLKTSCGSPNYAAPELISGQLYAGPEVDIWSCGVILYAMLCGSLPFDDEFIPNLFRKIKSGMFTLPNYLSHSSKDLILRMLVVDPLKRISMKDLKKHPWYQFRLPIYLTLSPMVMDIQERSIDVEIIEKVCQLLPSTWKQESLTPQQTVQDVISAGKRRKASKGGKDEQPKSYGGGMHGVQVAYELLVDAKRQKMKIEDLVLELQESSYVTPPAGSPWLSVSNTPSLIADNTGPGGRLPAVINDHQNPTTRRRMWYLGINSKKDPGNVMNEVYNAILALNCKWYPVNHYRALCLWRYTTGIMPKVDQSYEALNSLKKEYQRQRSKAAPPNSSKSILEDLQDPESDMQIQLDSQQNNSKENENETYIKAALSVYKVQQSLYVLDFQRMEGDAFGFLKLCAYIITELRNLSASKRTVTSAPSFSQQQHVKA